MIPKLENNQYCPELSRYCAGFEEVCWNNHCGIVDLMFQHPNHLRRGTTVAITNHDGFNLHFDGATGLTDMDSCDGCLNLYL